jgi:branched-chain amino acid transport system permease protein
VSTVIEKMKQSNAKASAAVGAAGWAAAFLAAWLVAANVMSRGLPAGIVVKGLVQGSFYALIALGIVLVYRANRVVNFAQAEFGSVAAVLAIELRVHYHLEYFAAIVIGFIVALITGALINVLVINRFRKASRLILSVVTIGLAQILTGIATVVPVLIGKTMKQSPFTTPFHATFNIYPVRFNANYVVAIVVVVAVMIGLSAFFRFSDYGVAIRAAAENGDRANLLGIPVPRLSTIVWSMSALLSAIAVIMRVPILGFNSFGSVSGGGNALLLRTLAAAVIGRMENLPRTVVAALAIGVFEGAAAWQTSNTVIVDALMVVIILGALLLQRDAFSRAMETGIATFKSIREVRPVPEELRSLPEVRLFKTVMAVALGALVLALPLWLPPSKIQLAALIFVYSIVAISLVVLTGWAGHISLGQFALVGIGGSTTAVLYERHHVDLFLAMLAGIVVSGLVALIIGLPALRIRGPFLAVTTLAFAVTSSTYFLSYKYMPWFVQSRMDRPTLWNRITIDSDRRIYYMCLIGVILVAAAAKSLRYSRTGRALIAVRDNEAAAETVTLNTTRMKLTAFVISGGIAGFAGALYVIHQKGIYTGSFDASQSIQLFSMVVIGGLGSLPGAVIGAIYVAGAKYLLPAGWSLLASGFGILFLLMFLPEGLGGLVYGIRDSMLRRVAIRRNILVPSLLADMRVDVEPVKLGAAIGQQEAVALDTVIVDGVAETELTTTGAARSSR